MLAPLSSVTVTGKAAGAAAAVVEVGAAAVVVVAGAAVVGVAAAVVAGAAAVVSSASAPSEPQPATNSEPAAKRAIRRMASKKVAGDRVCCRVDGE